VPYSFSRTLAIQHLSQMRSPRRDGGDLKTMAAAMGEMAPFGGKGGNVRPSFEWNCPRFHREQLSDGCALHDRRKSVPGCLLDQRLLRLENLTRQHAGMLGLGPALVPTPAVNEETKAMRVRVTLVDAEVKNLWPENASRHGWIHIRVACWNIRLGTVARKQVSSSPTLFLDIVSAIQVAYLNVWQRPTHSLSGERSSSLAAGPISGVPQWMATTNALIVRREKL
jgi:hypothetical protein